jgi:hypothetical protein
VPVSHPCLCPHSFLVWSRTTICPQTRQCSIGESNTRHLCFPTVDKDGEYRLADLSILELAIPVNAHLIFKPWRSKAGEARVIQKSAPVIR